MQRIHEQMYEQYRNKKSREAFIELPMQWGATVHPIIYTYIYHLVNEKYQFTDTAPYNPMRLKVRKIRYSTVIVPVYCTLYDDNRHHQKTESNVLGGNCLRWHLVRVMLGIGGK